MRFARAALIGTLVLAFAGCGSLVPQQSTSSDSALRAAGAAPAQLRHAGTTPAQLRHAGLPDLARALPSLPASHAGSWMAAGAADKSSLLYVADEDTGNVLVYSYPKAELEGTLTGFYFPSGMCSDEQGDVYILNGGGTTVEVFAHGGTTPLRTLDLPGYPELNCSVDKSGDLALGVLLTGEQSAIAVFADGQGTATTYQPSGQVGIPGCGYDPHGNLYCDAYSSDDHKFVLYELPKGSSTVSTVSVSGASSLKAGPVQWADKGLAVGSGALGTIYQLAFSGSGASVTGSTTLYGTGWVWQFWVQGKRIIVPTYAGGAGAEVGYWSYPGGVNPTKTIPASYQPDGATISTVK